MPIPNPFTYPFPQPVGGVVTFDDAITQEVTYEIYTRQRWADSWAIDPQLDLLSVSWAAAPSEPTAVIRYRYGRCLEIGASVETTRAKKNLQGFYVKIVVFCADGQRVWFGFVQDVGDEQHGIVRRDVSNVDATGVQTFACVGIIAALDRAPINRTYFQVTTAFSRSGSDSFRSSWSAPAFNVSPTGRPSTEQQRFPATRSNSAFTVPSFTGAAVPSGDSRTAFRFVFDRLYGLGLNSGLRWTLSSALEYLAAYNAPRVGVEDDNGPFDDGKSEFVPVWIFDHAQAFAAPNDVQQFPGWFEPILDCDRLTLKGALDRLLPREAGLGYTVWVDDTTTPNRIYVEPFTTVASDITGLLDEGGTPRTFPRNRRTVAIVCATDAATAVTAQTVGQTSYTAVQVVGAPYVAVCSLRIADQFSQGWETQLETDLAAEIAGLNTTKLRDLNRIRDIQALGRYRAINRQWRLLSTWDFRVSSPARDLFQDFNYPAGQRRYLPWPNRLRILDGLPFREGVDYAAATVTAIRTAHNAARTPTRAAEVYARSHLQNFQATGVLAGKWVCWSNRADRDVLADMNEPPYRLTISELENDLMRGVSIDVENGPQEVLTGGGGRVAPHMPRIAPNELTLTVAIQSDRRFNVQKRNPASINATDALIDADRVKVFDVGNRLQFIEVLKDTVVGINESADTLRQAATDYVLRDDTALATQICEFLATYYFQPRAVIRLQSRRASARLWPGQIVTTVNASTPHAITANALISEVSITFGVGVNGTPTKPIMSVQTSFGELDPMQFFPQLSSG